MVREMRGGERGGGGLVPIRGRQRGVTIGCPPHDDEKPTTTARTAVTRVPTSIGSHVPRQVQLCATRGRIHANGGHVRESRRRIARARRASETRARWRISSEAATHGVASGRLNSLYDLTLPSLGSNGNRSHHRCRDGWCPSGSKPLLTLELVADVVGDRLRLRLRHVDLALAAARARRRAAHTIVPRSVCRARRGDLFVRPSSLACEAPRAPGTIDR